MDTPPMHENIAVITNQITNYLLPKLLCGLSGPYRKYSSECMIYECLRGYKVQRDRPSDGKALIL